MSFHAVCSIDSGGAGTLWTAELLWYSWQRMGQNEPLTFLSAGGAPPIPGAEVTAHPSASWDGADFYPPFNQIAACRHLLEADLAQSDSILLLEPDMVLLAPLDPMEASSGRPAGHGPWLWYGNEYMGITQPEIAGRSSHPELVRSVGVPLLIQRDDLAATLPGWLERTREARREGLPKQDPWCATMFGLALASADCGLQWQLTDWGRWPLLHYMGATPGAMFLLPWTWKKHTHQPWNPLPAIPAEAPDSARAFAAIYEEYRQIKLAEAA